MFKGSKSRFKTDDKRCKIVDVDKFYTESHWCVERWWSKEEKIELGIEEDIKSVDLKEFRLMINDIVSTLSKLDEPLNEIEKKKR